MTIGLFDVFVVTTSVDDTLFPSSERYDKWFGFIHVTMRYIRIP